MAKDKEEKAELLNTKENNFSPIFFEVGGTMGKVEREIHWATTIIMVLMSVLVLAGIIASSVRIPDLFRNLVAGKSESLMVLLEYAAEVLMAVELIHVIIAQNMNSVIEILMVAFTRELVIKQWQMWELLFGVAIIGGLFAIKKYLAEKEK